MVEKAGWVASASDIIIWVSISTHLASASHIFIKCTTCCHQHHRNHQHHLHYLDMLPPSHHHDPLFPIFLFLCGRGGLSLILSLSLSQLDCLFLHLSSFLLLLLQSHLLLFLPPLHLQCPTTHDSHTESQAFWIQLNQLFAHRTILDVKLYFLFTCTEIEPWNIVGEMVRFE